MRDKRKAVATRVATAFRETALLRIRRSGYLVGAWPEAIAGMILQMRLHCRAADHQSVRVRRIPWRNVANRALIGITGSGVICGAGCCRRLRFHCQESESKKNTTQNRED